MKERIRRIRNKCTGLAVMAGLILAADPAMARKEGLPEIPDKIAEILQEIYHISRLGKETQTESETETGTEMESKTEADTGTETESETETGIGTETGAETEIRMETDNETETDSESGEESGIKEETERGSDKSEVTTSIETEHEIEVENEVDLKTEFGTENASENGAEEETRLEKTFEMEIETGMETETNTELVTEKKAETGRRKKIETESETEMKIEVLTGTEAGMILPSWNDTLAQIKEETEIETETEKVTEKETENDTEGETDDSAGEQQIRLRNQLSVLPQDFTYAMRLPEEEMESELMTVYELKDMRELHGRHPVFSDGEKDLYNSYKKKKDLPLLQNQLAEQLAEFDGNWSVFVKNLKTEEYFVINDHPMKSASIMKLFILGTIYQAADEGELELTEELLNLMRNMISFSDNESANQILYRLGNSDYKRGIARVDAFIRENGFSDMTHEYNGFNSEETLMDEEHLNQVSAKDCGKLLEDVYRRNRVSRKVSNQIESMLMDQTTRYKIPAGLPDNVLCGNKTGEMDTTENDAAIIYGDECDYILVVLSSDWKDRNQAISRIAGLSALVYDYLEK